MEQFDMQVMLKDGTFADFQVKTDREAKFYEVYKKDDLLATFKDDESGSFVVDQNQGHIDDDLQARIIEQLKGFSI